MKFLNFILLISGFWAIPLYAYDWPIKEDIVQHVLTSVMGECRQDRDHFHRGIDINAPCSTSVYTIEGDTCYKDLVATPRGINIGHFRYYHMVIADTIQDTTWLAADSFFAKTDGEDHVHLQEADTVLKSPSDLDDVNWLNLLRSGGISPFEDSATTAYPVIRDGTAGIKFWRQGTNDTISRDSVMDGRIDISVDARDPWTDSLGGSSGAGNMGVYKNYGYVFANSDTSRLDTLIEFEHHKYDICPSDQNITYAYAPGSGNSRHIYLITNNPYDTLNPQDYYWNTKQQAGQLDSVDADSIEVAKFKDGYFWVKAHVYDIKNNSDVESLLVHVDNFNPRVKETRPGDWFAFVPTKEKRVWCSFSEQMDTTTLNATNIKIQSLKADSFNYPITNFTYIDSIYKLYIEVDSFRFKDTVQVRLLDGVKDLAGKSIDTTGSEQTIAYSWTFVVAVIQLTDNDVDDVQPDVYHGNIVWTEVTADSFEGEIMLHNFYNSTTTQISPGGGRHNYPVIWKDKVVWRRYLNNYYNPIYYYDGTTAQQIASGYRGRPLSYIYDLTNYDIDSCGIVLRSFNGDGYPDTIWIEYYNFQSSNLVSLDSFVEQAGRLYQGKVDIDGEQIVWDHCFSSWDISETDIYFYDGAVIQNITNEPDSSHRTPVISDGQISWVRHAEDGRPPYIWLYDGLNKRRLSEVGSYDPEIDNGRLTWIRDYDIEFYDGWQISVLSEDMTHMGLSIHNGQAVWKAWVNYIPGFGGVYNASLYNQESVIDLTDDLTTNTYRIEIDDGFVVYDAWDGNDYEIYLYIGDTLFTPPAVVRTLRNDIIEADANDKQVKLTWSPNSESDLAGYKIYRSDTSYQYDTIPYDSVLATDTIFTDTIPLDGYNYYVVTAYDNTNYEGGFSNQTEAFIDVFPPSSPYIAEAEKSGNDAVLTWNKITTDTLGNSELMHYYVVYRNTSPSFIPASSDSIGYVSHPDTTFTDEDALISSNSYYYLVKAVDWARNKSKKSNMGYKLNKEVIENPSASDRNWMSLPWHSEYSTVSDLTTDLSSSGDPLIRVTNLRNDQMYEDWIWDPDFFEWAGANFAISPGRGYEVEATDSDTVILVGSNDPDGLVSLNENPNSSDRNWVSIPYNAYSTVSDITTEYAPSGDPLTRITNLRNDQMYEDWIWDPDFFEWAGANFAITPGRGYEFEAINDTTWNPTEYTNETDGILLAGRNSKKSDTKVYLGKSTEPDRAPVWLVKEDVDCKSPTLESKAEPNKKPDNCDVDIYEPVAEKSKLESKKKTDYLNADIYESISNKCDCKDLGNRNDYRVAGISHIVRAHLRLKDFENLVFTAYRPEKPYDVLTENVVGSVIAKKDSCAAIWFNTGNFKKPWQHEEKVILIIEAIRKNKGYFTVVNFKLDKSVDIQELGEIKLASIPDPVSKTKLSSVCWNEVKDVNVVGYSLYKDDERINEKVITEKEYLVQGEIHLKPVIQGGYETVYSSNITTTEERALIPLQFSFGSISPNPFTKHTEMKYALPSQVKVDIVIFDIIGRKVRTLVSERQEPGYYSKIWDGADNKGRRVSSGIYFIRFKAGEFIAQNKILLVK